MMKVLSLRLPEEKLKKIQAVSDKTDMDLTSSLRMLIHISLDITEKGAKIPLKQIPEDFRSPEFMFMREVFRVKRGRK